jgi:CubicO group peptidase (beta-lactamase class C family)
MKCPNVLFVALFLLISCAPTAPIDQVEERIKKVETHLVTPAIIEGDSTWTIEERMLHYGVPGVSIAVIKDLKIDFLKSYGVMDRETKEPVINTSLFQAGSISKPVASYGSLRLVEEKKIDLDENINEYLTSWKLPDSQFTTEKKVSLKHLLSHTGGLTVHGFWGYSPDLPVPTLIEVLNGTPPANSDPILVDKTPEESYRYSGGGYTIMQQMLIDIEGKSFPEILKELVLDPLGMMNSTYDQPLEGALLERAATGYLPDGTMTKGKRHTYPEMAAAGLWTTAEDLAKFAINIQKTLKGESTLALSKEMTQTMLHPYDKEGFPGLGIFIRKYKEESYFGHGGWDEGFSSEMIAHEDKGHGVVVLTNSNHPDFISELIRSVALTYNWEEFVPKFRKMEVSNHEFENISGRYLVNDVLLVDLYQEGNKLYSKELGLDPYELIKVSDSTYFRRKESQLLQFKLSDDDSTMVMYTINPSDDRITNSFSRVKNDHITPLELLTQGKYEQSLLAYKTILSEESNNLNVKENVLNGIGYHYKSEGKIKLAQQLFKINTLLYPESSNVYDSYAEVSMDLGETELAIANYQKSLDLNPKNTRAQDMIAKLRK